MWNKVGIIRNENELKEAKKQLKNLTTNYSGNGNIIKSVSPEPGTIVKENSTIKILLGN